MFFSNFLSENSHEAFSDIFTHCEWWWSDYSTVLKSYETWLQGVTFQKMCSMNKNPLFRKVKSCRTSLEKKGRRISQGESNLFYGFFAFRGKASSCSCRQGQNSSKLWIVPLLPPQWFSNWPRNVEHRLYFTEHPQGSSVLIYVDLFCHWREPL